MRRALAVAFAILLVILPAARAQDDLRDPGKVSGIISVLSSPQLAPGDSGVFLLNFTNPFDFDMMKTQLNVSIYEYATVSGNVPVNPSWGSAYPKLRAAQPFGPDCEALECEIMWGHPTDLVPAHDHENLSLTVLTSNDMPHGSPFSEAAYFLRFWLEFDFNNTTVTAGHARMASRGYFSDEQWLSASTGIGPGCSPYNATNRCVGTVNLTRLGVDGVLPDSSFGVKEPFPTWPLYALLFFTGFFLVLAFLFWVEENPSAYPRIDRAWLRLKGRLRRVVRPPGTGKI